MIAIILCGVFAIAAIAAAQNGEWGPATLGIVIILAVMFGACVSRRDTKAWNNRQNYWANGGPEKRK